MGIYLPMSLTLLIPVGAVIGHFYNKWAERAPNPEFAERMGVLMATGLIVGESLFGVAFAAIVGATDNDAPLALVEEFAWAVPLGIAVFAGGDRLPLPQHPRQGALALAGSASIPPHEAAIR